MIVRYLPGGRALVDRQALATETGLSEVTIRMRLRASAYDPASRRALYDHDEATAVLRAITAWPAMQGRTRRRRRHGTPISAPV